MSKTLPLPDSFHHIHHVETDSAMLCLRRPEVEACTEELVLVTADFQTAGRGQRGTTWESAPAKNLLFGLFFRPTFVEAAGQFRLSEAMALAVAESLGRYADGFTVKWPNDIYYGDEKICGMLLEHDLCGSRIARTRVGVGVNVNQERFYGNAPNPVSLRRILGRDVDRDTLLRDILQRFLDRYRRLADGDTAGLDRDYAARLYRREGLHRYRDGDGLFRATLVGVLPNGQLQLRDEAGHVRTYAFKEVSYVLPSAKTSVLSATTDSDEP